MSEKLSGLSETEEKFFLGLQKAPKLLFVPVEIEQDWRKEKPLPEENVNFLPIGCTLRAFSKELLLSSRLGMRVEEKNKRLPIFFSLVSVSSSTATP